ncbi:MAG: type II toxin-antitoxin system prevent-host-death family antitoxin [Microthrixaceae bacterium]|nr:type II toxin-antitoxin system prevent-host-death family antitoxin [Microthrixaceae bacterium]
MAEVTHRQLRNDSGEVLRRVAAGETILVTNHGRPAAMIGPPPTDVLEDLAARGRLRPATTSPGSLGSIRRTRGTERSDEIVSDVRGRW